MSLFHPPDLIGTTFAVLDVDSSVQESLVSTLVVRRPCRDGDIEPDAILPVDQVVRLMKDIPELSLRRGELGIVVSVWCAPVSAYEVEFYHAGEECSTRVLVFSKDLQAEPSGCT